MTTNPNPLIPSKATKRRQRAMLWAAEQKVLAERFQVATAENRERAQRLAQRLADKQLADDALHLIAQAAAMRYIIEMKGHTYSEAKQRHLNAQLEALDDALLELADAWADALEQEKRPRTLLEALVDVRAAQAKEDEELYGGDDVTANDDILFIA